MLRSFLRDEGGQDLIEYTLLLAFVALTAAALMTSMKTSVSSIWTNASSRLKGA
jgi:Flp pilus assembly pilin Flp